MGDFYVSEKEYRNSVIKSKCNFSPFNKEENSIGRPIRDIVTGYVGSKDEVIWNPILGTQKTSYIKEFGFDKFEKGITYWDSTQTPIFENGTFISDIWLSKEKHREYKIV